MPNYEKIYLSLLLFSASIGMINAQRVCGTMEHHETLLNQDPSYVQKREQIEQHTQNFVCNEAGRLVVTIPIVFHVVYNTASQNISDAKLLAQID